MQKRTLALWLCLLMILMPMTGFTNNGNSLDDSNDANTGARGEGCTDTAAVNYDAEATADDGSCKYYPVLLTPNGGEEWAVGSGQNITWSAEGWSTVSLYYSNDVGDSWILIDIDEFKDIIINHTKIKHNTEIM